MLLLSEDRKIIFNTSSLCEWKLRTDYVMVFYRKKTLSIEFINILQWFSHLMEKSSITALPFLKTIKIKAYF